MSHKKNNGITEIIVKIIQMCRDVFTVNCCLGVTFEVNCRKHITADLYHMFMGTNHRKNRRKITK